MSNFEKRYAKLNERQKEAVDAIEGPVMVIAGPGSGKTELLGLRVANILRRTDASPEDILCLTFTEAAARNMRERLAGLIGKDAYKVAIHTFHSFGSEIINRHPEYFYQGADYVPIDDISKMRIVENIIENLEWKSRLKSYHPQQGYVYLKDMEARIEDIKKGGLTPGEFRALILENKDFEEAADVFISKVFKERISPDMISNLRQLLADIAAVPVLKRELENLSHYRTLKENVVESLERTVEEAESIREKRSKTKPITKWKKEFLKKNAAGEWLLKSHFQNDILLDLAKVYEEYQDRMHNEGFYDFADMILDTVRALETESELRYEIQEKYLYVLVDEFQDTSGVQMRLLDSILNMEINEGRPNILVVGDDDQSIYKFQGANLDNVNEFLRKYKDAKKIVLVHNYRSTQEILDYSKGVIEKVEDRLVEYDQEITKDLICANPGIKPGKIAQREFETKIEQYIFIAEEIKKIKLQNADEEIVIISRKHDDLEDIAALLNYYDIPVLYERNKDILEDARIREIITIAKFINSLNQKKEAEADEYLPDILSFPFWGINRLDIWKICCLAHKDRNKNWLEIMLPYGGKVSQVAEFLIALGTESKRCTMEEVLDFITGIKQIKGIEYASEFKDYYFSKENFEEKRLEYLDHLFDLQTLFGELRDYRSRDTLYIKDLVEFFDLHMIHNVPIYKTHRLSKGGNAVSLMTAHKAKGLEFDSVFIINCNENSWMKNKNMNKLSFPVNIPLIPEEDNTGDKTRLFFVAVTRAKSNLYLTNYSMADGEKKASDRLRFLDSNLATEEIESLDVEKIKSAEEIISFEEDLRHYEIDNADEEELLRSILENYQLSITHLNNFLDVTSGGPAKFLEQNLLRFPSAKNASSSYGTAIHDSFREFYKRLKEKNSLPELDDFLNIFEYKLKLQDLNERDFMQKLDRGKTELSLYYKENEKLFDAADLLEIDFQNEGVMIGECPITGKIDRISLEDKKGKICKVYDYKTGKPFADWRPSDEYLKIKSYKYKDQLIFYKFLIENSRSYHKFRVNSGGIDFITAQDDKLIKLDLEILKEDEERLRALIEIVYKKIMALDFPDISGYSAGLKGILEFEDDLLSGRV